MIQPFSDATNATKMDNGTDSFRPCASKNVPIESEWLAEARAYESKVLGGRGK